VKFQKGNTKGKGRPKGAQNKKTLQWEALSELMTGDFADGFQEEMLKLKKNDPEKFIHFYIQFVKYFKPVQTQSTVNVNELPTIQFLNVSKSYDIDEFGNSIKK
jgi:hypothetical protein